MREQLKRDMNNQSVGKSSSTRLGEHIVTRKSRAFSIQWLECLKPVLGALTPEQLARYHEQGYIVLKDFLDKALLRPLCLQPPRLVHRVQPAVSHLTVSPYLSQAIVDATRAAMTELVDAVRP